MRLDGSDSGDTTSCRFSHFGQMTIKPVSAGLWAARNRVRHLAGEIGAPSEDSADLLLAVGEALSNAYRHGCPDPRTNVIHVAWRFADEVVTITVKDEGRGFTPYEPGWLVSAGGMRGRGLRLMRMAVDEVQFEHDRGARVTLRKRITSASMLRGEK